jgi:hypothetical protein
MSKISSNTAAIGVKTGVATLDFGSSAADTGDMHTTTVVTGVPRITATSIVSAQMRIEATPEHGIDELLMDPIQVRAFNLVAGVGFTVEGRMFNARAYGTYKINWTVY